MFKTITIMYLLNTFLASFTLSQNVSQQTSKLRFAINDIITRRAILAHVIIILTSARYIDINTTRRNLCDISLKLD